MKPINLSSLLLVAAVFLFTSAFTSAQTADSNHMNGMNMKNDSSKAMNMRGMKSDVNINGPIDLIAVDKNNDGKVYQCPMDFNVLSDKPGIDPKCGMKLKEVSLRQARKNLIEHGFRVSSKGVRSGVPRGKVKD